MLFGAEARVISGLQVGKLNWISLADQPENHCKWNEALNEIEKDVVEVDRCKKIILI